MLYLDADDGCSKLKKNKKTNDSAVFLYCKFSLFLKDPDFFQIIKLHLSYDVASGSEITPCNKICKPLVVYRFTGNVMTSITTLCTNEKIITYNVRNETSK